MKNDNWYPWFPGDFKRDTAHLTLAEQGAYRNLLDAYYCNGPLPWDDAFLRRTAGMTGPQWARSKFVILQFFTEQLGVARHKKCDLVIASREHIKNVRSEAGIAANTVRWGEKRDPKRIPKPSQRDPKTIPSTTREEREKAVQPFSLSSERAGASAPATAAVAQGPGGPAPSAPPALPSNGTARTVGPGAPEPTKPPMSPEERERIAAHMRQQIVDFQREMAQRRLDAEEKARSKPH